MSPQQNTLVSPLTRLSWNDHVSLIIRFSKPTLTFFRRSRHLLPPATSQLLESSVVFPYFDYGSLVFGGLAGELDDRPRFE